MGVLDATCDFLLTPWCDAVASAASILGLAVSLYVLLAVSKISRRFQVTARIPALSKQLNLRVKALAGLLGDFDGSRDRIWSELSACAAIVGSMVGKLSGPLRTDARKLRRSLRRAKRTDREGAWNLHGDLNGFLTSVRELEKDTRWSS